MARTSGSIVLEADVWASDPSAIKSDPSFARNEGWPDIYQKDVNTEGGVPPAMSTFNQLYWNVTALAFEVNRYGGGLPWDVTIAYKRGAVVLGADYQKYVTKAADVPAGEAEPSINPAYWELEGSAASLASFNEEYPIGRVIFIDGDALPPRQGQDSISWELQAAGYAAMTALTTDTGLIDNDNPLDNGSTDPHTLVIGEIPNHFHNLDKGYVVGLDGDSVQTILSSFGTVDNAFQTNAEGGNEPHLHNNSFNVYKLATWKRVS